MRLRYTVRKQKIEERPKEDVQFWWYEDLDQLHDRKSADISLSPRATRYDPAYPTY